MGVRRTPLLTAIAAFAAFALAAPAAHAAGAALVRVPQDAATLDVAISRVADGGVVELAAGSYLAPANGFAIRNAGKGFTVRAAAGAGVVLEGGGSRTILRFINSNRTRGKRVTFERLTFRGGYNDRANEGGAVTVSKAEALFRQSTFVDNRTGGLHGGGAVKVLEGSEVTFVDCSLRNNSARLRGGALVVRGSLVTLLRGELVGNRTNLPGHDPHSFGGAVMVLDGTLRVTGTRFESNEAGWVGGAIYAIGSWNQGADLLISGASFIANQALPDPCCAIADPSGGGAVHVEDLTTLRIHRSSFERNRADIGAAVDGFRAAVEVHGSVFQGNQLPAGHRGGAGGAIAMMSTDSADASTGGGAVNRPPGRLLVTQSLVLGAGTGTSAPTRGGCLLAAGDGPRVNGDGGVPQAGTLAENRARVEIRGSVFADCDAGLGNDGGSGFGGAIFADLAELTMEDSMVLNSDARGSSSGGGAVALRQQSHARIARTTFARNSAEWSGGALYVAGSTVDVGDSRFYGNDVAPGAFESLGASHGSAIFSVPDLGPGRPLDVGGVVASSTFADEQGLPLWELDTAGGPFNTMRYDGNRFAPALFGERVMLSTLAAPNGASTAELNNLSVSHAGVVMRKSLVANARVFGPREGALVVVPAPNSVGASPSAPNASVLAYAWTGGSANVAGFGLGQKAGLLEVGSGDFTLAVDGSPVAAKRATGTCTSGPFLCLNGNRFRAEVSFVVDGARRTAQAVSLTGDTGAFWFFDPANVELIVKELDGRGVNGHFWTFFGALTNLEHTLTVTDTATGAVRVYQNPAGKFASAGDTSSFAGAASAAAVASLGQSSSATAMEALAEAAVGEPAAAAPAAACMPSATSLCLSGSRIRVEATWRDFAGHTGVGHAVALSGDTGYFWFTSADNVEVVTKVLDGRGVNGQYWFFYGALSNVEYTLTITDVATGRRRSYTNPMNKFGSLGDTSALPAS